MKKTAQHKKIESLMWSKPEPIGARLKKWAVVNPAFVKIYDAHRDIMTSAGFVKEGNKVTWTSDYAKHFVLPIFPKREKVVQQELWKETPQEPSEDSQLATALENFATLQKQFEDMQRLYDFMKAENEALRAKINAR